MNIIFWKDCFIWFKHYATGNKHFIETWLLSNQRTAYYILLKKIGKTRFINNYKNVYLFNPDIQCQKNNSNGLLCLCRPIREHFIHRETLPFPLNGYYLIPLLLDAYNHSVGNCAFLALKMSLDLWFNQKEHPYSIQ